MEKEELDKKGTNTEYLPIKCRITRPAPPKPATNPLQFVKVGPCPLYKKAQEQIKKVEEVKVVRQEIREEAEDWQHNLDSWKSSRRKRQEHIIERVEEVKKIEQEVQDRGRKRTTFNEILEKRNRGRTKITIPIYDDDDSNDLSDYGIGAGNTKLENEKVESLDNSNNVNQGDTNENITSNISNTNSTSSINSTEIKEFPKTEAIEQEMYKKETSNSYSNYVNNEPADIEQYTYEGAIQNYRSRIKNKININESIFNNTPETTAATKDYSEVQSLLPKGNLYKRKEIFESEKTTVEIQPYESKVSQKLSEDFANTQTLKQRLKSLEKCTEQLIKNVEKNEIPVNTISSRLQKFNQITEPPKTAAPKKVPLYVPEKSSIKQDNKNDWSNSKSDYERYSSAEEDIFMDKLNMFNRDLDTLYPKSVSDNCLHDFITSPYPPSSSSTDVVLSSDKEDSGIHTADVSCSVSQSDEALEDIDISTNTIPRCIEKLNQENDAKEDTDTKLNEKDLQHTKLVVASFLKNETDYSSECHQYLLDTKMQHSPLVEHIEETIKEKEIESATADIIMENLPPLNDDIFINPPMPNLQPPTQKPPPPPPVDEEPRKQIKKELLIKRSSFLGLPESPTNQIDPNELIEAPPDVNSFLQKEKSLYKKLHNNLESKLYLSDAPKEHEKNNGVVLEEDEITKKEREIIELVEKEEKSKDFDNKITSTDYVNPINDYIKSSIYNDLGSKKFDSPYFVDAHFDNLDEQDSEVLKVEHELLQLEREELERQRENMLFHEKNKKIKQNQNSYDNLCGVNYYSDLNYCKSMPDLQQAPVEYANKSMYTHYSPICDNMQYCKSMPDIQHGFNRPMSEYYMQAPPVIGRRHSNQESAFKMPIPEKPLKHLEIEQMRSHQTELDNSYAVNKHPKYMNRQSFPTTASSRLRHTDNWKQPKVNPEVKSYDQHWLFQEAELRRLSEQNLMARGLPDKDMCDTNKLYKQRLPPKGYCDQKPPVRLPDAYSPKNRPRPYLGHSQTGHALPMSYQSPSRLDDGQDVILSVSGKKKCSYCGNELGRGAAMIIETLGLFYHMECFKCCVCHVELGDGLMGTDVRVRNQKLHCHNCYSSDDGVKFSCV